MTLLSISSNNLSKSPFQLIHYNFWGFFHTSTTEGCHYLFFDVIIIIIIITIVDDYTHFTWVPLLNTKSKVTKVFSTFFSLIRSYLESK